MSLGNYDKVWCNRMISDLFKWHMTVEFRNPVDPIRNNAPNYYEKVKKPMDLSTIRKKLSNNEYTDVQQFVDDIDQIYQNSLLFNGDNSMITFIAQDISTWIKEQYSRKASSQEEEWRNELHNAIEAINEHMKNEPPLEVKEPENQQNKATIEQPSTSESQTDFGSLKTDSSIEQLAEKTASESQPAIIVEKEEVQINEKPDDGDQGNSPAAPSVEIMENPQNDKENPPETN